VTDMSIKIQDFKCCNKENSSALITAKQKRMTSFFSVHRFVKENRLRKSWVNIT